jgi:hypothetical protein
MRYDFALGQGMFIDWSVEFTTIKKMSNAEEKKRSRDKQTKGEKKEEEDLVLTETEPEFKKKKQHDPRVKVIASQLGMGIATNMNVTDFEPEQIMYGRLV